MTDAFDALVQLAREIESARQKVKMTGEQAFNYITLQAKHNYTGSCGHCVSRQVIEVEGKKFDIELHRVGHNASHRFYVGLLPDGRLVVRSYCLNEDGSVEENVSVQGTANEVDFPKYLGHY